MGARTHLLNILEARRELDLWIQGDFARFLGVSRRTVIRHAAQGGLSSSQHLQQLVHALAQRNPRLAADLARTGGLPPAASPKAPVGAPPPRLTDEVMLRLVHAAADALDVSPKRARAALRAFFREAAKLEADVAAVAASLNR